MFKQDQLQAIRERLVAAFTRTNQAVERPGAWPSEEQLQRLIQLPERLDAIERRMEEIVVYFAHHSAQLLHGQSTYLGDHTALTRLQSGQLIYVDTRSIDIASHVLAYGLWEPGYVALFQRLLRPGQTAFDIGANIGIYSLAAASVVGPTGRVVGFEPNHRLARLARQSLLVNGYGFADIHALAVSDQPGETRLVFNHDWSGGGHLEVAGLHDAQEAVPCGVVTLDQMFPDPAFTVDVMKIDVEGFEGHALRGMQGLITRSRDIRLIMEFGPALLRRSGTEPAEMLRLLEELGFRAWMIGADGSLTPETSESLLALPETIYNLFLSRQEPG